MRKYDNKNVQRLKKKFNKDLSKKMKNFFI